jgi:hypothetical protein
VTLRYLSIGSGNVLRIRNLADKPLTRMWATLRNSRAGTSRIVDHGTLEPPVVKETGTLDNNRVVERDGTVTVVADGYAPIVVAGKQLGLWSSSRWLKEKHQQGGPVGRPAVVSWRRG